MSTNDLLQVQQSTVGYSLQSLCAWFMQQISVSFQRQLNRFYNSFYYQLI